MSTRERSWSGEATTQAQTAFRVVSLFSGAGGFDWGFKMDGGYTVDFANELNLVPATTFARNFFDADPLPVEDVTSDSLPVAACGDIASFDFATLPNLEADVLIGGPPCQDFSVIKGQNREGTRVKRGKLYLHFVHAVARLRPRAFVFENVPGLTSVNGNEAFQAIQSDLQDPGRALARAEAESGFEHDVDVATCPKYELLYTGFVDAHALGAPQTRRRLIIIGLRHDEVEDLDLFGLESAKEWLKHQLNGNGTAFPQFPLTCLEVFEGKTVAEIGTEYREVMESYRSLPEDLPGHKGANKWLGDLMERWTLDARTDYLLAHGIPRHSLSLFGDDFDKAMEEHEAVLDRLGYLNQRVADLSPADGTNDESREAESVLERMRRIPPGENYKFVDGTKWQVEGKGLWLIYRRPFPLEPAPTVVAYGGGGTYAYHYARNRSMLTNRERARLQTFPDDFLFSGTLQETRWQIGEAVPPLLSARVAKELRSVLS